MSFTVFLGNLPTWVTADDIKQWLAAEDLVADAVKVIRNHETQESKGFAFVEAPTADEMQSIIRRFDRAPLEDRLLRANPAQPPKGKDVRGPQQSQSQLQPQQQQPVGAAQTNGAPPSAIARTPRPDRKRRGGGRDREQTPRSAFATELAKVL
jgi:RNA recognition motif-containing protein